MRSKGRSRKKQKKAKKREDRLESYHHTDSNIYPLRNIA